MPLILARLEDQDEIAKKNGWIRTFNRAMPWDSVFAAAVEEEGQWWRRHIETPGTMVNCGVHAASHYTDGDATVSNHRGSVPTGSDTSTVLPAITDKSYGSGAADDPPPTGTWQRRTRRRRFETQPTHPKPTKSDKDNELCNGFQIGKCMSTTDGLHCAAHPSRLHKCAYCRKQGHGENVCWLKNKGTGKGGANDYNDGYGNQMPWMRGGRGNGGGGGRGGGRGRGGKPNKGRGRGGDAW